VWCMNGWEALGDGHCVGKGWEEVRRLRKVRGRSSCGSRYHFLYLRSSSAQLPALKDLPSPA
jgi:hypothetical protein